MFFNWFVFFVLSAIVCQLWIKSGILAWFIYAIILLLSIVYMYKTCNSNANIPQYTNSQMHNILQHGDIMTMRRVRPILSHTLFCNERYMHCSLIIEENNTKYVVEAVPNKPVLSHYIMTTKPSLINNTWYITKTPLLEYLLVNSMYSYRVYRSPIPQTFTLHHDDYYGITPSILVCTVYIGKILERKGLIQKSNYSISYRTDKFINTLEQSGYTGFTFLC